MRDNAYSHLKAFRHPDVLHSISTGVPSRLPHVELILSDLCQQHCKFCLTESAIVDTLEGSKSIAKIVVGDEVWGPDGRLHRVTETSSRECAEVIRISVGNQVIEASPEHPILTESGWKTAGEITTEDRAAIRLHAKYIQSAPTGREHSSTVSMRMHAASKSKELCAVSSLGKLYNSSSEHREDRTDDAFWDSCGIKAHARGVGFRQIDSVLNIVGQFTVYNFTCVPGHAYYANGIVVHNCAYRLEGYASNQLFDERRMIRTDKALEIIDDCAEIGVQAVQFSVHGDEGLPVITPSGNSTVIPIGEFVDSFFSGTCVAHEEKSVQGWSAFAIDDSGVVKEDTITKVYRHPSVEDLNDVILEDGRSVLVTASHSLNVIRDGKISRIPVSEICTRCDRIACSDWKISFRNTQYPILAVGVKSVTSRPDLGRPVVYDITVGSTHRFILASGIGCFNTGGGEPTLHPGFDDVIRRVASHGMRSSLVSNGVRIDQRRANILGNCSWIRISLDAATEETYCSTRKVNRSHWVAAQNSVRYLREMKSNYGHNSTIGVGFVVTPDNWNEVYLAGSLAKELGADNFRISAQFSNEDERLFESFHANAAKLCLMTESLSDAGFTVYNRFGDRLEDLRLKSPEDKLCGYQFFTTYIGADLNVYRCCGYAYNERGLIGSIKEQRFKDFWMSQERFDKQINFDGRGCERCQFRRQNAAIAYAVDPQPQMHEEFV